METPILPRSAFNQEFLESWDEHPFVRMLVGKGAEGCTSCELERRRGMRTVGVMHALFALAGGPGYGQRRDPQRGLVHFIVYPEEEAEPAHG